MCEEVREMSWWEQHRGRAVCHLHMCEVAAERSHSLEMRGEHWPHENREPTPRHWHWLPPTNAAQIKGAGILAPTLPESVWHRWQWL